MTKISKIAQRVKAQLATRDPASMPKKPGLPLPRLLPYLRSAFDSLELVWIDAKVLDQMWALNTAYYLPVSYPEPKNEWFSHPDSTDDRYGIIVAVIGLETVSQRDSVCFTNGRHRTRWLMSCGFSEIIAAIDSEQVSNAMRLGLVTRRVVDGDRMVL